MEYWSSGVLGTKETPGVPILQHSNTPLPRLFLAPLVPFCGSEFRTRWSRRAQAVEAAGPVGGREQLQDAVGGGGLELDHRCPRGGRKDRLEQDRAALVGR